MTLTSLIKSALLSATLLASTQAATFYFNGGGGEAPNFTNQYVFNTGGVTATVTAFGLNGAVFSTAGVTQWSGGLGVSNQNEGLSPGSPNHSTDNSGHIDFLRFQFSTPINLTNVTFGWVQTDSDFKYWIGNNLTTTDLGSGGTAVNGGSAANVPYGLTGTGNTFWLAASPTGGANDYFKVKSLTFNVPEAGSSLALLGLGLAGLAGLARRIRF